MWGAVLACMAGVNNYSGALAVRFFLGVFEAAVTPGFALFTSQVRLYVLLFLGRRELISSNSGTPRVSRERGSAFGLASTDGRKSSVAFSPMGLPKGHVCMAQPLRLGE